MATIQVARAFPKGMNVVPAIRAPEAKDKRRRGQAGSRPCPSFSVTLMAGKADKQLAVAILTWPSVFLPRGHGCSHLRA